MRVFNRSSVTAFATAHADARQPLFAWFAEVEKSSWSGPEVASTLAVAATCLLAGQRWAIALIAFAELLLAPTLAVAAFHGGLALWPGRICALVALLAIVPGLLRLRRAAAVLVLLTGVERTNRTCRRVLAGIVAIAAMSLAVPFL